MPILKQSFFNSPTEQVAKDLLGKYLMRQLDNEVISLMITDVEVYDGPDDKASHASKGITSRTELMFGPAGYWYVYLIYGMHWILNVITDKEGYPAGVMIRGTNEISGPGRITKHLSLDKSFYGSKAEKKSGLWIEDRGVVIPKNKIQKSPRIGVDYAGEWAKKEWRFFIDPPSAV